MNRQHRQARTHDFTFMESAARIRRFVASNLIVPLEGNSDYLLHEVSYPYARPAVRLFIERLSRQFRSTCGETLTVTSLTRPVDEQPGNAHGRSVHPTGMAVDLRVPRTQQCRDWLNRVLLSLEAAGVLEATRERSPAHYHVAVFPIQYEQYVQRLQSRRRSYVVQRGRRAGAHRPPDWHLGGGPSGRERPDQQPDLPGHGPPHSQLMVLTDFSHPRDSPGSSAVILGPGSGSMPIRATLEHTLKFKEAGTLAGHRDVLGFRQ